MLFTSIEFVAFFIVVVVAYFLTPSRFQWVLLLAASYFFYGCWHPGYLALIGVCTVINYGAALLLHSAKTNRAKKGWLAAGVSLSLAILFVFKYLDFFNLAIRQGLRSVDIFYGVPSMHLLLPVGISFFTFQSLSYTIDVYRGEREPTKHFGIFALYVSFFPQLVAGPIERSTSFLPQFFKKHPFSWEAVKSGSALVVWGLFKKLVIADRLAVYVNEVYNNVDSYHGLPVIAATYFFAFQIYCDFSGYTDIAVGTSRIMGFRLMENFDRPYFASSFAGFWRRWHISLSTWFRDYLYIPLGGNRGHYLKQYRNLVIVFLASALWHGADWTFLAWGAVHVVFLIAETAAKKPERKIQAYAQKFRLHYLYRALKILFVFHMVTFAWLFFRANSISDAVKLIENAFAAPLALEQIAISAMGYYEIIIAVCAVGILELISFLTAKNGFSASLAKWPLPVRFFALYFIIVSVVIFGQFTLTEFIYFQF